jgi:bis(5'-nucleosidyl)-tetraphosphatase
MQVKKRSAGIVVTRRVGGARRYLLLRCYRYWDFPKGEIEPGEDPLVTACREVAEETGLTDLEFHWGDASSETAPYSRGKVARYYLAESAAGRVTLPVSPELGAPEHHEFRWASYEEAKSLLNDRVGAVLDWARARAGP